MQTFQHNTKTPTLDISYEAELVDEILRSTHELNKTYNPNRKVEIPNKISPRLSLY